MEEGIITYEKLYEILRLEKYKKELQKLDHDLFNKTVKYLDEKKAILDSQEKKDSVFASQSVASTKRQLENTKMILKELYERREAKIIQIALFNSRTGERMADVDALLKEEINSFKNVEEKKEKQNKFVRFLESVPKFVGDDLNEYGPYEAEDMANLPIKISEILIKNNRAEEV